MASENNFKATVDSLFKGMDSFITAKTVVGEAITVLGWEQERFHRIKKIMAVAEWEEKFLQVQCWLSQMEQRN